MGLVVLAGYLVVVVKVREVRLSSSLVAEVWLVVGGDRVEVAMDEDRKMVEAVAAVEALKRLRC